MAGISDMRHTLLALLSALLLTGCSSLTSLYFHPQSLWLQTPDRFDIDYRDEWITSSDGIRLHAWRLLPDKPDPDAPVVLYLHGNAENISTHARSMYWMVNEGVEVLALDYRGYGASEGRAVMPGVLNDVKAAALWWRAEHPNRKLAVVGQSMGAALAVNLASEEGYADILVADAAFAGFPAIARSALGKAAPLGWLVYPFTLLIPNDWDPETRAHDVSVPTLMMHSRMDEIIPYEHGRKVYSAMQHDACWLESIGPHIGSFRYDTVRSATLRFLRSGECPE